MINMMIMIMIPFDKAFSKFHLEEKVKALNEHPEEDGELESFQDYANYYANRNISR